MGKGENQYKYREKSLKASIGSSPLFIISHGNCSLTWLLLIFTYGITDFYIIKIFLTIAKDLQCEMFQFFLYYVLASKNLHSFPKYGIKMISSGRQMNQDLDTPIFFFLSFFFFFPLFFLIHLVIIEQRLSCFNDKLSSPAVTMSPDGLSWLKCLLRASAFDL